MKKITQKEYENEILNSSNMREEAHDKVGEIIINQIKNNKNIAFKNGQFFTPTKLVKLKASELDQQMDFIEKVGPNGGITLTDYFDGILEIPELQFYAYNFDYWQGVFGIDNAQYLKLLKALKDLKSTKKPAK